MRRAATLFPGPCACALAFLAAIGAAAGEASPAWRRPVQLEAGTGFTDAPYAMPLGIAVAEGEDLAILYGIRTDDFQRYAVYVRWSRDGGATWQDRKLLGQTTWVSTGVSMTLSPRLVRSGGTLAVIGAWEDVERPEDPRAPQTIRLHRVSPDRVEVLREFPCPPEESGEAVWVHRLGLAGEAVWGVRGRQVHGKSIELQPFLMTPVADGATPAFAPLSPWQPSARGWVTDTLSVELPPGAAPVVEGYDLAEGGWVVETKGSRVVEDPLEAYRASVAPVVACHRWARDPAFRLAAFLDGKAPRAAAFARRQGRWVPLPARWEQPCHVWDAAGDADRFVFAASLDAGIDEIPALFALDPEGKVSRDPAFAGLAGTADGIRVALAPGGRVHLLFRAFSAGDDREEFLLVRAKGPRGPGPDQALRAALERASREVGSGDADTAATARALLVEHGLAAVASLRRVRAAADNELAREIDRILARIVPTWADAGTYSEED